MGASDDVIGEAEAVTAKPAAIETDAKHKVLRDCIISKQSIEYVWGTKKGVS